MPEGLRVLITNNTLDQRAGSELYVRDLAVALLARGHSPVACSTMLGDVADELRAATIPVVDHPGALRVPPDVIHGQHHLDAMAAMLRFPTVPAVYMCHGWLPWEERPPLFPSIRRYVAVDDLCRERLETTPGVQSDIVRTIYQSVDLRRFTPRAPLPTRPRSALVFSNQAAGDGFVEAIRAACRSYGIERVDVIGARSGQAARAPEAILGHYDVVFAKARCALEAMAVGCAVVVADAAGLGGLVTPENVEPLRRLNFGVRTLQASPMTVATVLAELDRYEAQRSLEVCQWIRQHAAADTVVDQLIALYREVAAERTAWSAESASAACMAASAYVSELARTTKERAQLHQGLVRQHDALTRECQLARTECDDMRREVRAIRESRTWRSLTLYRRSRDWWTRARRR